MGPAACSNLLAGVSPTTPMISRGRSSGTMSIVRRFPIGSSFGQ
jgi:hypothetical protein